MIYILLIFSSSAYSVEFNSKEACEAAKVKASAFMFRAVCVEKGKK